MTRAALITIALLAVAPAYAFDSGIRTWDGTQCLIEKTGEIVTCTKDMLDGVDRDMAASAVRHRIVFPKTGAR